LSEHVEPEYVRPARAGQDLAVFDQLHAEAIERLRGSEAFLLFLRGRGDDDGTHLYVCSPDGELDAFSRSAIDLLEKLRRDQSWDT
jgi:hypothetical protein